MKQWSLTQALSFVVGVTYLITGGTYKVMKIYQSYQSPHAYLCRIVQTGPQREALKTTYLAELMGISANRPVTVATFNPQFARQKLLSSPVIKEAEVRVMAPDTVYIDYTVRQPLAWLYDFENTALDEEGYLFPVFPFFTPKNLPEFYLGIQTLSWNVPLTDRKAQLALTLLQLLQQIPFQVKRIDVSKAFEESLGAREVVLTLDEQGFTKILRLTPKNFAQELGNYLELHRQLPPVAQIIDLRIPHLAFIQEREKKGSIASSTR